MDRARDLLRDHADRLALVALGLSFVVMPGSVPGGIVGIGLVSGVLLALQGVGLVLVFRSNRFINFAQVQTGVVAGVLFRLLVAQDTVLRAVEAVCAPCVAGRPAAVVWFGYVAAAVGSVVLAAGIAYLAYVFVIRRLSSAGSLVATVVTIGLAQLGASVASSLPGLLATGLQRDLSQLPRPVAAPPPVDWSVEWSPAIFRAPEILTLAIGALVLGSLFVFLRRSDIGVAIRAAASNPDRAATVGVPVQRVTSRVWALSGLLAGVAAVLGGMATASTEVSFDVAGLVRVLAVAVFARFTSLPAAVGAGLAVGVFDEAMLWTTGSRTLTDGLLLVVIAVVLGLQRALRSRVDTEPASAWRASRESRPLPAALRDLDVVRSWTRGTAVAAGAGVLGLPWVLSSSQANAATIVAIYAMIGLSLLVLTGWAGQISLGHFAFAAVGGYAAAASGLPMPAALVVGGLAGAALAVAVGVPSLRLGGLELSVTTLAVALGATAILLNPTYLGKALPDRLPRPGILDSERVFYYLTLVLLAGAVTAVVGLRRSRTARALIAARDNEPAAQTFGVAVVRARLVAFALSGFLAAFAGALFAFHQKGVHAAAYAPEVSVLMFLMVVIGGLGSVAGPLAGALAIGVLDFFSASPLVTFLATGGGVVLLLLVAPGGLGQLAYDVRDAFLRGVARRAGVEDESRRERVPIAPKVAAGTAGAFVPERYRLPEQWPGELAATGDDGR